MALRGDLAAKRPPRGRPACRASAGEIRVCTNKTCKKQGSAQTLKLLEDLTLDEQGIVVTACGCLGNCGAGPNVALLPQGLVVTGIATPAQAFQLATRHAGASIDADDFLAVALRLEGNRLASAGNLSAAIDKYRSALTHAPAGTAHKLHSNISLAALGAGQTANAIAAAHEALKVAPADFTTAKIRLVEAYVASGDLLAAREYLDLATQNDESFRSTPIYERLVEQVKPASQCA